MNNLPRVGAQPQEVEAKRRTRACARAISSRGIEGIRVSFLSHLITIIRAVITTISMVIKKIAIRRFREAL